MLGSEHLDGAGSIYVVLETDYRDAFKEPVNLREVERLQEWLESQPEIGGSTSLVDYLKLIHRGFHGNDPSYLRIPESKRLVTQLFYFGASDEVDAFVDSHFQTLSVNARTSAVDSREMGALVERVERRLEELPEHIRGRVTGNSVLIASTLDEIAWGQAMSLLTAFLFIYAILCLLFTSMRVGFLDSSARWRCFA